MKILHKSLSIDSAQVKFDTVGGMKFSGYASKFNDIDSYGDTIAPGAYLSTLSNRKRPIQMRWNHYGEVIGKWMKLEEDDYGLFVEGELTPNHSKAADVYALLKHGAIDGLSIGYMPKEHEMLDNGIRVLKEIELFEISIVEQPADLGATISDVKNMIDEMQSFKEMERFMREAWGVSRSDAALLLHRVKEICQPSESEQENQYVAIATALTLKAKETHHA